MLREYEECNVYERLQARLELIFEEFENIYISFSGGKDSGLLLNLVLDGQSGTAGVETRLESFIDIIRFKEGQL